MTPTQAPTADDAERLLADANRILTAAAACSTTEFALAALGYVVSSVFRTHVRPECRAEAVDDWCCFLMANTAADLEEPRH